MALWEEYNSAQSPEAKGVKGLDKLETILQHNQGLNPPDFDYAFNLDYGQKQMQGHPLLPPLRQLLDAETQARHEKQSREQVSWHTFSQWPADWAAEIVALHSLIFKQSELTKTYFLDRLEGKKDIYIQLATSQDQLVAYKIGYQRKARQYYSWVGGVHPDWRKRGLACHLMQQQHQWCKARGYKAIRTHSKNKWKAMLILNLKQGYEIIGSWTDQGQQAKIMLEKQF